MPDLHFVKPIAFFAVLSTVVTFSWLKLPIVSTVSAQQSARPNGLWLDHTPVNWNRRMSGLPRPVSSTGAAEVRTRCPDTVRPANSPAEHALARAGWMLYGKVQSNASTKVVLAMSGADGMCRPLGYQAFVYWDGRYAGTLSPAVMDSRTDGALTIIRLISPTSISAEFVRYNESDPRCCPTRISHVTYEVSHDEAPLVTAVNIKTVPTSAAGEGPGAGKSSVDATSLFGRRWNLTEMNGSAVGTTKPYIEFDREAKRVAGHGGCNRIAGGFEVNGTNLKFSRVISTKMACLDRETQQVETDFLKALEQTTSFTIQDDVLRLYAGGPPILTFKAGATEAGGTPQEP